MIDTDHENGPRSAGGRSLHFRVGFAPDQRPINLTTADPTTAQPPVIGGLERYDRMNHLAYRVFEGRSWWAGRDRGGLAILDQVGRNFPGACGVKLVKRIDARPAETPDLKADVWPERAGIQKLALWGISSTSRRLIDRVQQVTPADRQQLHKFQP
jgi:hypothetical protein